MSNIKIGVKLVSGFILVALIVVIVGAIGWRGANNLSGHIDEVGGVNLPAVNNLRIIETEFEAVVQSLHALTNPALSMQERQAQYQEIEDSGQRYQDAWNRYENLPQTQEEEQLWQEFKALVQEWTQINEDFLERSRELEQLDILNTEEFLANLQRFRGDHYEFMENMRVYIDFGVEFESAEDPEACSFGQWLQSFETDNQKLMDIIEGAIQPHYNFHAEVDTIRELVEAGKQDEARMIVRDDMGRYADHIFLYLQDMIQIAEEANKHYAHMNSVLVSEATPMQQDSRELLGKIIELNEAQAYAAVETAESDATAAIAISQAGLVSGLILALALGLILTVAITRPLNRTVDFAEKISQGNLDEELTVKGKDELGILGDALRKMVENLKTKIQEAEHKSSEAKKEADKVHSTAYELEGMAERLTSASEEFSTQVEQSSRGAEQQSLLVEATASSMDEMKNTVLEVAQNASQAAEDATQAKDKAQRGAEVVEKSVQAINKVQQQEEELKNRSEELKKKTDEITKVMNVIEDIADQTNLLALNAAIEASRAGEAGRGFAVVADEVRKLAEKTMNSTKEVEQAISTIQAETDLNISSVNKSVEFVDEATSLVNESGRVLTEIVEMVQQATDQVHAIATATDEQSAASEEVNRNIEEVNRISSETSDVMKQSAQAISNLSQQANELQALIRNLKS